MDLRYIDQNWNIHPKKHHSIATSQQYFRRNHGKPGCAVRLEKIRKISEQWTDLEIFLL